MLDRYGRNIDYLRISLTDRCNLRCIYCMPEEGIRQIPRTELLDTDEIVRICKAASELGISRIKLTGGEPLVRRICTPLVKELKAIPRDLPGYTDHQRNPFGRTASGTDGGRSGCRKHQSGYFRRNHISQNHPQGRFSPGFKGT